MQTLAKKLAYPLGHLRHRERRLLGIHVLWACVRLPRALSLASHDLIASRSS